MKRQEQFIAPRYLTYDAAAIYMGISSSNIRKLIHAGKIKYIRLGGRVLVDNVDIDKFMAKLKGHSPQQGKTQEIDDNIQIDDELTQVFGV